MIRRATIIDKEDILNLIDDFYQESLKEYNLKFTDYTLDKTVENFIKNHSVLVVQENGEIIGVIGGMLSPSIFDEDEKIMQEFMWYIKKDFRKGKLATELLKSFEDNARELGAKHILMVHMGNLFADILDKFYKRHNYKLIETQYIKKVV